MELLKNIADLRRYLEDWKSKNEEDELTLYEMGFSMSMSGFLDRFNSFKVDYEADNPFFEYRFTTKIEGFGATAYATKKDLEKIKDSYPEFYKRIKDLESVSEKYECKKVYKEIGGEDDGR